MLAKHCVATRRTSYFDVSYDSFLITTHTRPIIALFQIRIWNRETNRKVKPHTHSLCGKWFIISFGVLHRSIILCLDVIPPALVSISYGNLKFESVFRNPKEYLIRNYCDRFVSRCSRFLKTVRMQNGIHIDLRIVGMCGMCGGRK